MADFNLSADIEVQKLILNADLRKQLENVLKGVKLDPKVVGNNKVVKALNSSSSTIPLKVRLQLSNPKGFLDSIFGRNRTLGVKLKVTNLSQILKSLSPIVDPSTIKKVKIPAPTIDVSGAGQLNQNAIIEDIIGDEQKLANTARAKITRILVSASKSIGSGGFFDFASSFASVFDSSNLEEDQIQELLQRFSGLSGNDAAIKNFVASLESLFATIKKIDDQSARLRDAGIVSGPVVDNLSRARTEAVELFNTIESSNPKSFRTQLSNLFAPYSREVNEAIKDTQDFNKLIEGFNRQQFKLQQQGVRTTDPRIQNLTQQSLEAQKLRGRGFNTEEIKSAIAGLDQLNDNLTKTASKADNAVASLSKLRVDKLTSGAGGGRGAQLINFDARVADEIDRAIASIGKLQRQGADNKAIQEVVNRTRANVTALTEQASSLNGVAERLTGAFSRFDTAGLIQARDNVQQLVTQVVNLVNTGASLNQIEAATRDGLIRADKVAEDEKRISGLVNAIERLRGSLLGGFDANFDVTGVGERLNKLQDTIRNFGGNLTPERDFELKGIINEESFDIRALNKANTIIDTARNKFIELAITAKTPAEQGVFREAGTQFAETANTIVRQGGTARQTIDQLNQSYKFLLAQAKTNVEGGVLNSILKQAGLAAKRLAGFLIVGPAFFAVGDSIRRAVTSAVDLEIQFTKLEQVLSRTYTSEQQLTQVTSNLRKEIFDLAKTTGIASQEIVKATRILAQAGIVGEDLSDSIEAITRAQLGPTFEDIGQTSEALVAILNQFNLAAKDSEAILGGINAVASTYAVEADGIAKAVRKAGAAFNAAGGSLQEFVGAFTILKSETREADEALGTGLRTIANRLQRSSVEQVVKNIVGVNIRDTEGQFKGFATVIGEISRELNSLGIEKTDRRFNTLVESIAGLRQRARLLPLLEDFDELADVIDRFENGGESLGEDVGRAVDDVGRRIEQLRASLTELVSNVTGSSVFKGLVSGATALVQALSTALIQLSSLRSAVLALAGIQGLNQISQLLAAGGGASALPRTLQTLFSSFGFNLSGGGGSSGGGGGGGGGAIVGAGAASAAGSLSLLSRVSTLLVGRLNKFLAILVGISGTGIVLLFNKLGVSSAELSKALLIAAASAVIFSRTTRSGIDRLKDLAGGAAKKIHSAILARGGRAFGFRAGIAAQPGGAFSNTLSPTNNFTRGLTRTGVKLAKFGKQIPTVGAALFGLNLVIGSVTKGIEENANRLLSETTSEDVAIGALEKLDNASLIKRVASIAGNIIGGGVTGATVGAGVGGVGAIPGLAIGGITGFLSSFIDFNQVLENSGYKESFDAWIDGFKSFSAKIKSVADFLGGALLLTNFTGYISYITDFFDLANFNAEKNAQELSKESLALGGVDLNQLKAGEDIEKNIGEFSKRFVKSFETLYIGFDGDIDKIKASNPRLPEQAEAFVQFIQEQLKAGKIDIDDVEALLGTDNKIAERFQRGLEELGSDFNLEETKKQLLQITNLGRFLARLSNVLDIADVQLNVVESNLQRLTSRFSDDAQFRINDSDFANLEKGFVVGGRIGQELEATFKQFRNFNKGAAKAFSFDLAASNVSRRLSNSVIRGELPKDTNQESLKDNLIEAFQGLSGGNRALDQAFANYIDKLDDEKLQTSILGQLDPKAIQDIIVKEFGDSIKLGGLDAFKRFVDVQNQFTDQFKDVNNRRLAEEKKLVEGIAKLGQLSLGRDETIAKITGRDIRSGSASTINRTRAIDTAQGSQILQGTGLNVGASAKQLVNFIQQRRTFATNPTGSTPQERELNSQRALIDVDKATQFLQFIVGGTNELSRASKAFEERAQRSREASELLKKSLFGSDEEVINIARALQDMQTILMAGSQQEARNALLNLGDSRRQALDSLSPSQQEAIQQRVGFGSNVDLSRTQEAKDLISATNAQVNAQKALNATFDGAIGQINRLNELLQQQQQQALNTGIVNQFTNAANILNQAADKFPKNITAQVNGRVDVNVTGAQVLSQIDERVADLVDNRINAAFGAFNAANGNQLNLPQTRRRN